MIRISLFLVVVGSLLNINFISLILIITGLLRSIYLISLITIITGSLPDFINFINFKDILNSIESVTLL